MHCMTARHDGAPPQDFLSFLQERHALDPAQARGLLSEWLVSYEPSAEARLRSIAAQGALRKGDASLAAA